MVFCDRGATGKAAASMAAGYKTSSAFDLGGLWGDSDDEDGEAEVVFVNTANDAVVELAGCSVRVRETAFHPQ